MSNSAIDVELLGLIESFLHSDSGDDELIEEPQIKTEDHKIVEQLIDDCLEEIKQEDGLEKLKKQYDHLDKMKDDIDEIFANCFSTMEKLEKEKIEETEVAISSDDDDVQFISSTFDESKKKQHQSPHQSQDKQSQVEHVQKIIKQQIGNVQPQNFSFPMPNVDLEKLKHQPTLAPYKIKDGQIGAMTAEQLRSFVRQPGAIQLIKSGKLVLYMYNEIIYYQSLPKNQNPQPQVPPLPAPAAPKRPYNITTVPSIKLVAGMKAYARKQLEIWHKCTVIEVRNDKFYRVRFDMGGVKVVQPTNIALADRPAEILPVGCRVIAMYREEGVDKSFYAGIIAEPPSQRNNHRYLVFFDDGYAQYCIARDLHRVSHQSRNVWDDIHPDSQDFIRGYLQQYPERPMVRLQKGQIVKTEWNGKWWIARVLEVDASLAKMYFESDQRTEWIYRGSTRLEPLYTELANQEAFKQAGKGRRHNVMKRDRRAVVEYFTGTDEAGFNKTAEGENSPNIVKKAPMAKKSTAQKKKEIDKKGGETYDLALVNSRDKQGRRVDIDTRPTRRSTTQYVRHHCGIACLTTGDPKSFSGQNPLLIPQLCGWERQICRQRGSARRTVLYRAPCGRRLRDMRETDMYLVMTKSKLTPDLFCFDPGLHTDKQYIPIKTFCDIKDLAYGKETVPISCVNGVDQQYPDYVEYSNQRIPAKGVSLNLNTDFLVGCDCTDGCRDKTKCACIQRTLEASKANPTAKINSSAPYKHRRLSEHVVSGIYECNSKCKCNCSCPNRVVQNGLSLRLQVFKTDKRGWGLRCLDDIPAGGFICIYAGQLLTEQGANEDGQQFGDEYLAELDYIEVVERNKEGYESDVDVGSSDDDSDNEEEEVEATDNKRDSDSDYGGGKSRKPGPRSATMKSDSKKKAVSDWLDVPEKSSDLPASVVIISDEEGSNHSTTSSQSVAKKADESKSSDKTTEGSKVEKGIANLVITEPTSLNIEGEEIDSDDASKKDAQSDAASLRRSSRQAAQSRFSNLPNPTSDQAVAQLQQEKQDKKERTSFKSTRHYLGEEFCYVMDAKSMGNLGRYLNHACSPNVFVQNVFVDTHDLRFPWVAFFAGQFIRAGTELTWDYNYEVGSVPGKVLYCYCASTECRGRLL